MESRSVITESVAIANQEDDMESVINLMIEKNISSVLVADDKKNIVGIITERDIVSKFTLISKEDKLQAKVLTVMTRPVHFVRLDHLDQDIADLHTQHNFRHFPVLIDEAPQVNNLVGMLTSTDIFRMWINNERSLIKEALEPRIGKIALIMSHKINRARFRKMLQRLNCEVEDADDFFAVLKKARKKNLLTIFDLDDSYGLKFGELLNMALTTGSYLVFITSRTEVAAEFKQRLKNDRHHILIKPIDFSYLQFLLHENQRATSDN
ncbi:MAG: hypothetical protein CMP10_21550 [Zetaproteobacteria bacterium]|nr:hypothetical protein [Pseudobdellovibrionaceae bacterium]